MKYLHIKIYFLIFITSFVFSSTVNAGNITGLVSVKHQTYAAQINEQPYYGFLPKTVEQIKGDNDFVASIVARGLTRADAAKRAVSIAWPAIRNKDFVTAARRLNQAWLLSPDQSEITHLFAIIVHQRFNDSIYAIELFSAAGKLKNPLPTLKADHARLLLILGRPSEAIPLLREAIIDAPDKATPKSNLAWALLQTGKPAEACELAISANGSDIDEVKQDIAKIRFQANC